MFKEILTPRGEIRKSIMENASEEQVTKIPPHFFGEIHIIGVNHKEAAEYFKERIDNCTSMGDEIKLHFEIEEKFDVAICNNQ